MVTTAVLDLRGMAWCSFCWIAPQACSLVGRERGRSIPFSDIVRLLSARVVRHRQWTPAALTGNFGGALEDIPIGDCRFVS
jgi:hypothetical protein